MKSFFTLTYEELGTLYCGFICIQSMKDISLAYQQILRYWADPFDSIDIICRPFMFFSKKTLDWSFHTSLRFLASHVFFLRLPSPIYQHCECGWHFQHCLVCCTLSRPLFWLLKMVWPSLFLIMTDLSNYTRICDCCMWFWFRCNFHLIASSWFCASFFINVGVPKETVCWFPNSLKSGALTFDLTSLNIWNACLHLEL